MNRINRCQRVCFFKGKYLLQTATPPVFPERSFAGITFSYFADNPFQLN